MPPARLLVMLLLPLLLLWLLAVRLATLTPWIGLDRFAAQLAVTGEGPQRLEEIVGA